MKKNFILPFSMLVMLLLSLSACEQDQLGPNVEDLKGVWHLRETEINGRPFADFTSFEPHHILGILNDQRFFLNYNSGDWTLSGDHLLLETSSEEPVFRNYQIVYSTADSLILGARLTERSYFIDIPQFESDQTFIAIERYGR